MAYCSRANLEAHFGAIEIADLLDRDNDGGEDTTALTHALNYADAIINGYLANRYTVPFASPYPQLISSFSADIVRYILWGNNAPDEVQKRRDDALKMLKDISNGVAALPGAAVSTLTNSGIEYVETTRIFTAATLADF